jgi:hypothetical protein
LSIEGLGVQVLKASDAVKFVSDSVNSKHALQYYSDLILPSNSIIQSGTDVIKTDSNSSTDDLFLF